MFWFLNLKVCYISTIIILVTHANLLVALPQKTILDMQQFCWRTSKLIEMDTKTMHAGTHREDKNQWGVKIKTHLNWLEKTAGWRIQLQMTSCVVCPIMDISSWSKSAMRNKIEKANPCSLWNQEGTWSRAKSSWNTCLKHVLLSTISFL